MLANSCFYSVLLYFYAKSGNTNIAAKNEIAWDKMSIQYCSLITAAWYLFIYN